jgi:23S rRNA G2069 N7-methylase RlmK/C1962 C5-methylase RlmI
MREVKLPEPAAFTTQIKEGRVIFMARVSLNTQGLVGIFTSDQLRQAVQEAVEAEREKNAQKCEALLEQAKENELLARSRKLAGKPGELEALKFWLTVSTYNAAIKKCAAAIRSGA